MTKTFFDISSLVQHVSRENCYSGIQRVVAMIISEFRTDSSDDIFLAYFDEGSRSYVARSLRDVGPDGMLSPTSLRARLGIRARVLNRPSQFRRYDGHPLKAAFHRSKLDVAYHLGVERPFEKLDMSMSDWAHHRQFQPAAGGRRRRSVPFDDIAKRGDRLIILDSSWRDEHSDVFRAARLRGLHVFTFVHDLIPILLPETTEGGTPKLFANWFLESFQYTSVYLANSKNTAMDCTETLRRFGQAHRVETIPLAQQSPGHRVRKVDPSSLLDAYKAKGFHHFVRTSQIGESIRALIVRPFVLCVGTIEPRKNILRLLQAWDRLTQDPTIELPRLVLAGRRGWASQDVFDFMGATGCLKGNVIFLDGPDDEELSFLYEHCLFAAMISLYEGWGLPVGEALAHGKTAVVSNVSALPEVGQDLVEYCDAMNVTSIADACRRLIASDGLRVQLEARIRQRKLRQWQDVAEDLKAITLKDPV